MQKYLETYCSHCQVELKILVDSLINLVEQEYISNNSLCNECIQMTDFTEE